VDKDNHACLRFCLQTILDFEPLFAVLGQDQGLESEFRRLEDLMQQATDHELNKAEVQRIESATRSFLKELEGIFASEVDKDSSLH
jgi:hypothetical protein